MKLDELMIDPEFAHIVPAISDEEMERLEKNILHDKRVLEPIAIWEGVIVDGHNRYKILKRHPDIPFTTVDLEFADRCECLSWIIDNQLGRRNLPPEDRKYLIGKRYEAEKMRHGLNIRYDCSGIGRMGQSDPSSEHGTRGQIAKETGKSGSYVKRAYQTAKAVDAAEAVSPGFEKDYRAGKLKVTDREMAAVLKASPKERPELVAELKKPPGERRKIALPVLKEKIMPERVYISPEELSDSELQPQPVISDSLPTVDSPGLSDILKEAGVKGISNIPLELPDRDDTNLADTDKPIEESILHSMHLAVVHLMESFNNYFYRFPALLEDPKYRDRSVAVVKEFETYISQIEKGVQENETAEP